MSQLAIRDKMRAIAVDMSLNHLDREKEIKGLMLAALSREHILFLGPPGSDKTRMAIDFASYFTDSKFFYWLMNAFTTPDEIFGPLSLQALKNEIVRRVPTNKLPEANFVMLDELFNASSAINNTLLDIIQERKFDNGDTRIDVPLNFVIAGSNQLPAEEEKLRALYDRFSLRYLVEYIGDDQIFTTLINMFIGQRNKNGIATTIHHNVENITLDELTDAQIKCSKLEFSAGAKDSILILWHICIEQKVSISERRWGKLINLMQADAWYNGNSEVESDNLSIASHMFWDNPEQIGNIAHLVTSCIDPDLTKAQAIEDSAKEIMSEFYAMRSDLGAGEVAQMLINLQEMTNILKNELRPSNNVSIILTMIDGYRHTMKQQIQDSL